MNKIAKNYPENLLEILYGKEFLAEMPEDCDLILEYIIRTTLSERESRLLFMRYKENMSTAKIGRKLGIMSEMTSRQLDGAYRKMREGSKARYIRMGMKGYIDYLIGDVREHCEAIHKAEISQLENEIARLEKEKYKVLYKDKPEILDTPIENFSPSVRLYNILYRAGCKRVGDIVDAEPENIAKLRNLGLKTMTELIEILKNCGFEQKADEIWNAYKGKR